MLLLKVFTGILNHKNPRNPTSPSNHTVYFKESVPFWRNCLVFRKWRSGRCVPMISQRNQINTLPGKPVLPEEQLHSAQGKRTHKSAPPWQAPSFFFLIKLNNKGRWQPTAQPAWDRGFPAVHRAPVLSPGTRHEEALLSEGSQKGPDLARKSHHCAITGYTRKGRRDGDCPLPYHSVSCHGYAHNRLDTQSS